MQVVKFEESSFSNAKNIKQLNLFINGVGNVGKKLLEQIIKQKKYLNSPNGGLDFYEKVKEYILFYNTKRRHLEIGKVPPNKIYYQTAIAC